MAKSKSRVTKRASARKTTRPSKAKQTARTAKAKKPAARKSKPAKATSAKPTAKTKRGKAASKPKPKVPRQSPPRESEWVSVRDPARDSDNLLVSVPAGSARPAADRDEAAYNTQALNDNEQISRSGALRPGETHAVEETADGERQLVRKRFSAI